MVRSLAPEHHQLEVKQLAWVFLKSAASYSNDSLILTQKDSLTGAFLHALVANASQFISVCIFEHQSAKECCAPHLDFIDATHLVPQLKFVC